MKLLGALIVTLFLMNSAFGVDENFEENKDFFKDVAGELRCPTCTGLSVLESDAGFSVQIKDQVKEQIGSGKSKEDILEFFVERYGPWILREPPKKGFNIIAWLVPVLLLVMGPVAVWAVVWRRRVNITTFGVRSNEDIIEEMQSALAKLKGGAK